MKKHQVLSADKNLSPEEILRELRKMSTRVKEVLRLHQITRDQLSVVASSMFLEIRDRTQTKDSPSIQVRDADFVRIKSIDKLRKNYVVLRELFETKTELESMQAKLRVGFSRNKSVTADKAIKEIETLKKDVLAGISEAFSFIGGLAKDHMPEKLRLFVQGICSSVEKSIIYESSTIYSYVFEVEGDICFTTYLHLKNLEDETGKIFPEMFLTMTFRTGNSSGMFVGIQHHFTPPSEDLLMKKVKSIKDALTAYSMLLELDDFSNTVGSLPLNVLLSPKSLVKEMFSYGIHVKSLEVDDHTVTFNLKSSGVAILPEITAQLYRELNSIQRRTNAKLRMSSRKAKNSASVSFRFVTDKGSPPIDSTDLQFMKDRFNLEDAAILKIVRVINTGVA